MKEIKNIDWKTKDHNKIEDGVYYNMPIDVYHGNKTHESASLLKNLFKSLAHYKSEKNKKSERKIHFDFGNAYELAITDKDEFNRKVCIMDESKRPFPEKNYQTKANKAWKDSFIKEAVSDGKLIIPKEGDNSSVAMNEMLGNFMTHKTADVLVKGSNFQTSIFWTDKKTGLKIKTRPDFWKTKNEKRHYAIVTDLKTDKDNTEEKHIKSICNLNYPVQSVIQMMGLLAAGLIDKNEDGVFNARFFWIVCSKSSPFNTEVYEFAEEDICSFTTSVEEKLTELSKAKKENLFLSYNPSIDFGIRQVRFPFYYRNSMGIYESIDSCQ